MQRAQIVSVCAFLLVAGWVLMPPAADHAVTGSIAEVASIPDAAASCDQPLYQEELELVTGLSCG